MTSRAWFSRGAVGSGNAMLRLLAVPLIGAVALLAMVAAAGGEDGAPNAVAAGRGAPGPLRRGPCARDGPNRGDAPSPRSFVLEDPAGPRLLVLPSDDADRGVDRRRPARGDPWRDSACRNRPLAAAVTVDDLALRHDAVALLRDGDRRARRLISKERPTPNSTPTAGDAPREEHDQRWTAGMSGAVGGDARVVALGSGPRGGACGGH